MASKYPEELKQAAEVAGFCLYMNARSCEQVAELTSGQRTEPFESETHEYLGKMPNQNKFG